MSAQVRGVPLGRMKMLTLNFKAYQTLINQDIAWLAKNTAYSQEREHIITVLRTVVEQYGLYNKQDSTTPQACTPSEKLNMPCPKCKSTEYVSLYVCRDCGIAHGCTRCITERMADTLSLCLATTRFGCHGLTRLIKTCPTCRPDLCPECDGTWENHSQGCQLEEGQKWLDFWDKQEADRKQEANELTDKASALLDKSDEDVAEGRTQSFNNVDDALDVLDKMQKEDQLDDL